MRVTELCEQVGLTFDTIHTLLFGKTLTGESTKFYSSEHKQYFEAKSIQLKIEEDPDSSSFPSTVKISSTGSSRDIRKLSK
ncbi:MAG: hypothetical protein LBV43_12495 [Prevotella sp.]|jgi:hypothetical protein|nr:hypothetical protein [Prevotella sp.]